MDKLEIIQDVKKHLGFDIDITDIKSSIQKGWLAAPFYFFKVIEWPTGASKTLPALKKIEQKKTLIVISQILHEENWIKESIKWDVDLSTCIFVCYNSLYKHLNEDWDLILLDKPLSN